jgi:dUTP pyrophosphatase
MSKKQYDSKKRFKSPSYKEVSQMILNCSVIYNPPELKIKKNYSDAKVPTRANPTDSGLDLYAHSFKKHYWKTQELKEDGIQVHEDQDGKYIELSANERVLIDTGISATVGVGYEIQIRPRSGLALKQGLTVVNTPGTIDEQYRGPIMVIVANIGIGNQKIYLDSRIAQMVVCPIALCSVEVVSDLDDTERGSGGFGSSGTK